MNLKLICFLGKLLINKSFLVKAFFSKSNLMEKVIPPEIFHANTLKQDCKRLHTH